MLTRFLMLSTISLTWGSLPVESAAAAELWSDGDAAVRLDVTTQFTSAARLTPPQPRLLANPNGDDGDRNFAHTAASDRTDIFYELDANDGAAGLRLSGAAWYDPMYVQRNSNNSPATSNPVSTTHDHFTRAVQTLEGRDAEVLDGFVHDSFTISDMPLSVRLGRHTLIWGESLFFGQNGVAVGQAPTDFIKAANVPNTLARELYLPVNQLSASLQLRPGLSIEAYDQLEWRADRLPGVGSYFSTVDFLGAGGERIITAPGEYLYHGADQRPTPAGQFGAALRATLPAADLGLYALRYNARQPFVSTSACADACALPGQTGLYHLIYARGIDILGVSAAGFLNEDIIAGEASWRHDAPLIAAAAPVLVGRRGDTAHAQISLTAQRPANTLWDRASLSVELAGNTVLVTTTPQAPLAPGLTRSALAMQGRLTFDYYHVRPALDVSPFMGLSYGLMGRSSVDPTMTGGAGNLTLGVQATYRAVWHLEMRVTDYLGSAGIQPLADRSFASFNIRRTF